MWGFLAVRLAFSCPHLPYIEGADEGREKIRPRRGVGGVGSRGITLPAPPSQAASPKAGLLGPRAHVTLTGVFIGS